MSKIMLVEDDNNLREIYEARLRAEGYDIVAAHDGEEALVVAKAEKPDLVISDVMMPKISGFEMLDILRNTDGLKNVKVIMLTALGQSDDQQRAQNLGADRYLVKSQVTLEDIVKAAHELLEDSGADTLAEPSAEPPAPQPTDGTSAPAASATTPDQVPAEPTKPPATPTTSSSDSAAGQTAATDSAAASDDQVMADAVSDLIADTEASEKTAGKPAAPPSEIKPGESPSETTADNSDAKPDLPPGNDDSGDKDKGDSDDDTSNSHVRIANKKVITPIESKPEKDLETLLAEEEAREATQVAGNTVTPSGSPDEAAIDGKAAEQTEQSASTAAEEEAAVEARIEDFVAGATTEPDAPAQAAGQEPAEAAEKTDVNETSGTTGAPASDSVTSNETTPNKSTSSTSPSNQSAAASSDGNQTVKPIVITEDVPSGAPSGSLSGNPGVPSTSPANPPSDDGKTSSAPNNIAL